MYGLRLRVEGLGFMVHGSLFGFQGLRTQAYGGIQRLGLQVQGLRFMV